MVHCDEASSFSCRWRNPPASVPHLWGRSGLLRCLLLAGLLLLPLTSYGPCSVLCLSSRPLSVVFVPPPAQKAPESLFLKDAFGSWWTASLEWEQWMKSSDCLLFLSVVPFRLRMPRSQRRRHTRALTISRIRCLYLGILFLKVLQATVRTLLMG